MEHGVKYVQGFAVLGTCFARIRTQLFHNHVPPDKAAGKGGRRRDIPLPPCVPFDLFTWREGVLPGVLVSPFLPLLPRGIRRDNRVIRVDRLINKSASIRSTISWKVKLEEVRENFRPRLYIFRDRERRSGNGCKKKIRSPNTEIREGDPRWKYNHEE